MHPLTYQHTEWLDILECSAFSADVLVRIDSGRLTGIFDETIEFQANLSDAGRFYVSVPKESDYLINGRSRFGAREYHVFKGNLDPQGASSQGYYQMAIGQMDEGGCEYPIVFERDIAAEEEDSVSAYY